MKTPALVTGLILTLPLCLCAGDFLLPAAADKCESGGTIPEGAQVWKVAAPKARAAKENVIEAAPGGFYFFRIGRDSVIQDSGTPRRVATTRVYYSPGPDDFGLKDDHPEAMHMVAEFPDAVTSVIRQGDDWTLILQRDDGLFHQKLTWKEFTPPVPAPPAKEKLRVALYDDRGSTGSGVPKCTAQLEKSASIEVTKLNATGIRAGLSGYHAVIFTGGSGSAQAASLGLAGREQVRRFVEGGGGYIGICAGAYLACDGFPWSVHVLDAKTPSSLWERGKGELKIEATDAGQSLLHLPATASVLYHNGPILTPGGNPAIPDYEPLVFFRTEVSKTPKHEGLQINSPAIVRAACGKGKVLISSPHPEQSAGMEHWIEHAVRAVAP